MSPLPVVCQRCGTPDRATCDPACRATAEASGRPYYPAPRCPRCDRPITSLSHPCEASDCDLNSATMYIEVNLNLLALELERIKRLPHDRWERVLAVSKAVTALLRVALERLQEVR